MSSNNKNKSFAESARLPEASAISINSYQPTFGDGPPPNMFPDPKNPPKISITPEKAEGRIWGYSGPGDWLGKPPVIKEWDEEFDVDVVVVGSGHAGVNAALAAAECGAKVAVLEKLGLENFGWYGEDFAAYNSRFQIEAGFGPYDLGEVVNEYCTRSGGRSNPEIVRQYVVNSGPTLDHMLEVAKEMGVDPRCYTYNNGPDGWLIIHAGMDYEKIMAGNDIYDCLNYKNYPLKPGTKSWAATHQFMGPYNDDPIFGIAKNSVLPVIERAQIEKAMALGSDWYFGTEGIVLTQNANGDVTGVIAKNNASGKYIKFNTAKGVVMAGGDFAGNPDMCWALMGEYMERRERFGGKHKEFFSPMSGRNGESIKMMCWAGGYIETSPRGTMMIGGGPEGPWGCNAMLWLNKNGERFTNEGNITLAQTAVSLQPRGLGCLVTDKKWLKSVCASGLEHGGPNAGRPQYYKDMIDGMNSIVPGPEGADVKHCIVAERGWKRVIAANTLEELASYLGYPEEVIPAFINSIKRYNELCYKGRDEDFGKDPSAMIPVDEAPFYGSICLLGDDSRCGPMLVTVAGVVTDKNLNVIDINRKPIKGLFTCGNSLGGRYGTGYCTPSAGNSIGFACTHGRLAGQNVCK